MRCKHGMMAGMCGVCRTEAAKPARIPELQQPIKEAKYTLPEEVMQGYVVIRTGKGRERCDLSRLGDVTVFVHIDGHPHLWAVKEILARAPQLKTIQVIPSAYEALNPDAHLRMCAARGVEVVKGHHRPELAWHEGEIRSPTYDKQRIAFLTLGDDAKVLFDELCALGFEEALITSRYFCLQGEKYLRQREVCKEFGLMDRAAHPVLVSERIYAVMKYLDPSMVVNNIVSNRFAESMRVRVKRLRAHLANAHAREELARSAGLPHLPAGLPLAHHETLGAIVGKVASPEMRQLAASDQRLHALVLQRYGLEGWEGGNVVTSFRTLEQLGNMHGGITRERVRQLLEKAYALLGIDIP